MMYRDDNLEDIKDLFRDVLLAEEALIEKKEPVPDDEELRALFLLLRGKEEESVEI